MSDNSYITDSFEADILDEHSRDHDHKPEPVSNTQPPLVVSNPDINFFGMTNFRNQYRKFGIKTDDRRRHMYVVGKTGMGKTTLLENMVLNDIYAGHGIGLVDPHGDFAEKIINYIPPNRINDVVYFNPADIDYPIGFNILETIRPEQKHLVASGLMGVFKKIWPDVWSARMEYILNNTILALLEYPGTTLLGINRLLADEEYRNRVVAVIKDPVVKGFWVDEFANYTDKFRSEAVAPIQNKIGQFLSASVIRNIVAQVKSRINIREIMDSKKIFIMNLSKGRIGEDNSRLLGGMLITKIQLAAMERVDIKEADRNDFFLYVDEFQNFATESFANILSEARKYRLDLIMAHQYMEQLDETVLAAVIGNVGTMVTFRVGSTDAEILAKEFAPTFVEEDLINLPKFQTYLKLMIDGVASKPFSAMTLPPVAAATGSLDKVIRVSRERYGVSRDKIEDKIMRWSGMAPGGSEADEDEDPNYAEPIFKAASQAMDMQRRSAPQQFNKNTGGGGNRSQGGGGQPRPQQGGRLQQQSGGSRPHEKNQQPNQRRAEPPKRPPQPPANPAGSEKVLLVDPGQKGISLSQLNRPKPPGELKRDTPQVQPGKPKPQTESNLPEPARVVEPAQSEPSKISTAPSAASAVPVEPAEPTKKEITEVSPAPTVSQAAPFKPEAEINLGFVGQQLPAQKNTSAPLPKPIVAQPAASQEHQKNGAVSSHPTNVPPGKVVKLNE